MARSHRRTQPSRTQLLHDIVAARRVGLLVREPVAGRGPLQAAVLAGAVRREFHRIQPRFRKRLTVSVMLMMFLIQFLQQSD